LRSSISYAKKNGTGIVRVREHDKGSSTYIFWTINITAAFDKRFKIFKKSRTNVVLEG
jgi:hypothetical protein